MSPAASHLTLRLTREDALLIERLRAQTGMSKTDIVKHALRNLADSPAATPRATPGLFALGDGRFGQHGDASRQSAELKAVVRRRVLAKRAA